MGRFRVRQLAILVVAVVAAGCGEPTHRFVSNDSEHTYVRFPTEWATMDVSTERVDRIEPESPEDVELIWGVAVDGSGSASAERVGALSDFDAEPLEQPVGSVSVYQVQGNYLQNLSLAAARSIPLGLDPLAVPDDVDDLVEIIDYQPLAPNDGLQGGRTIFNLRPRQGAEWRTYDIVTAFDQSRFRLYILKVGCSSVCFQANQVDIAEFVTSWKVKR